MGQLIESTLARDLEYGQLVSLASASTSSEPPTYQWRTADGVVEGSLEESVSDVNSASKSTASMIPADPILAKLNQLAKEGWALVSFGAAEPVELGYDRRRVMPRFVTARWWLIRRKEAAEAPQKGSASGREPPERKRKSRSPKASTRHKSVKR